MTFPESQYREVMHLLDRLNQEIDDVRSRVDSAVQAGVRKLEELRDWIGDVVDSVIKEIYALARKIKEVLKDVQDELDRLRVGKNAPLLAAEFASKWQNLRGLATQVSSDTRDPRSRFTPTEWSGTAAERYFLAVVPQVVATDRMATSMDKVATALLDAAKETVSFMNAMGTAITAIIVAAVAATAAIMTGVGAIPGVIAFVAACGVCFWAMTKAVDDYAAAQTKLAITLEGDAKDVTQFPGGKWPQAASALISDAPAP